MRTARYGWGTAFACVLVLAGRPAVAADDCPLDWDALADSAPPSIALEPMSAPRSDECPEGFDPRALLAGDACDAPDCVRVALAPGRRAFLVIDGPNGSGHFEQLGLVVDGVTPGVACLSASTVGWRHLGPVTRLLAPLPWQVTIGRDRSAVIAWQRLPWRDDEVGNGLVPVAYVLDGDRLVRRDDRAAAAAARVARAYRRLARAGEPDAACDRALASALARWRSHPR